MIKLVDYVDDRNFLERCTIDPVKRKRMARIANLAIDLRGFYEALDGEELALTVEHMNLSQQDIAEMRDYLRIEIRRVEIMNKQVDRYLRSLTPNKIWSDPA